MTAGGQPEADRPRIIWVGAFPAPGRNIIGGVATSCRLLLGSSFADRAELLLVDSSQESDPPPGLVVRLLKALRRAGTFAWMVETRRPDAVLLFASETLSIAEKSGMAWYARLRGVAAVLFPRGGVMIDRAEASAFTARWLRIAFRGAHVVLCQGPRWHRFLVDRMGVQPDRAPIVLNWTATSALVRIGAGRAPADAGAPLRILYVGWLTREKGVFDLVEACRRLGPELAYEVELVGDGVAAAELRSTVTAAGLDARIRFSGWLSGEELERAYARADAFVLPSYAEGLPNAMIEAMAAGLAVIVSAVGAVPGLVTDGDQALLVPPGDVAALAQAIARVAGDPELRSALSRRAADWSRRNFGVEPAADAILAAVARAVADAQRAPAAG